jgi:hypothetical protein
MDNKTIVGVKHSGRRIFCHAPSSLLFRKSIPADVPVFFDKHLL